MARQTDLDEYDDDDILVVRLLYFYCHQFKTQTQNHA